MHCKCDTYSNRQKNLYYNNDCNGYYCSYVATVGTPEGSVSQGCSNQCHTTQAHGPEGEGVSITAIIEGTFNSEERWKSFPEYARNYIVIMRIIIIKLTLTHLSRLQPFCCRYRIQSPPEAIPAPSAR